MSNNNFNDFPKKNERNSSIDYVESLIYRAQNDGNLKDIPQLEKLIQLLKTKKYGLVWEEHLEKVEEEMKTKIPIFIEDKGKEINNSDSEKYDFLLEGDNLHSLHLLEKTSLGKIDIIYIDPPYNTGHKDFKYNDCFVKKDDSYKHSKWLSFMASRLRIAKKLLSKDGIIFISIDDNEQSQLKLLMDEIFGMNSFVSNLHIETSAVAGTRRYAAVNGSVVKTAEFVLVYSNNNMAKRIVKRPMYDFISGFDTHYSLFCNSSNTLIKLSEKIKMEPLVAKQFEANNLKISPSNLGRLVQVNDTVKKWLYDKNTSKNIYRKGDKLIVPDSLLSGMKKNEVRTYKGKTFTKNSKGDAIILFNYLDRLGETDDYSPTYGERSIRGNLWKGFSSDGGNLSKEGGVSFKNGKKPKRLIKQLIKSVTDGNLQRNITVLDFFAGSGTTGQAVKELNAESAGNYHFILANNSEVIDTTYKRMKNVNNEIPMNLKYLKTDFVDKTKFPDVSLEYELLKYVTPLVELQFGIDITNPKVQIVLNEKQLGALIDKKQLISNSTLFMSPDVFLDAKQNQLLQDLKIKIQDIPSYFFGKELWSK